MDHKYYMLLAMEEAKKGKSLAPPNPWVGCIIMSDNKIIGQGHHITGPHAEINALKNLSEKITDSSIMYVTLEPCCLFPGKRTPSCGDTIVKSGIKNIVIGMKDPNPKVSGWGIKILESANINILLLEDIDKKLYEKLCWSMRHYIYYKKTGLPYITIKIALSKNNFYRADDKKMYEKFIHPKNDKRWITHLASRKKAHKLRSNCQSIMIGAKTLVIDDPELTVRYDYPTNKNYSIIIVDGDSINNLDYRIFKKGEEKISIFIHKDKWVEREKFYRNHYGNLNKFKYINLCSYTDMKSLVKQIDVMHLLIEGGGKLHTSFLEENNKRKLFLGEFLVNEIIIFKSDINIENENEHFKWPIEYLEDFTLVSEKIITYEEEVNVIYKYINN